MPSDVRDEATATATQEGDRSDGAAPLRIVSGGQTGVDRAALDLALELGLPCGGWCPSDRGAEDGPIDARYPLAPSSSPDPAQRTEWNVRDSDATLIISALPLSGGTALTARCAAALGRPCLTVPPSDPGAPRRIRAWLSARGVSVLNVAGPRESGSPGIYETAKGILRSALAPEHGLAQRVSGSRPDASPHGLVVEADDPVAMRKAIQIAFDYRGDVTITRRSAPEPLECYVFDRREGGSLAESTIRVMPRDRNERLEIACGDIARLAFTGRDTAAGKSFDAWIRKYVQKKLSGEEASIRSEPLEPDPGREE